MTADNDKNLEFDALQYPLAKFGVQIPLSNGHRLKVIRNKFAPKAGNINGEMAEWCYSIEYMRERRVQLHQNSVRIKI